ncbi:MAG: hypothetical protein RIS70_4174 [Planctomycetota bacterium]
MSNAVEATGDDCPLPVSAQRRNILCYAIFWCIFYLAAPVSYVGLTHANLLKGLGNNDTVSNLPSAVYEWLVFVPMLLAWLFPHPRHLKPLSLVAVGLMACSTGAVAFTLWSNAQPNIASAVVIGQAAIFGAANGVLITGLWDFLRRGVSTSRRGVALGFTFGIGPLFACVGALLQDAVFEGKLLGGYSFGLEFPGNYLAMFAFVTPLLLMAGIATSMFTIPQSPSTHSDSSTKLDLVDGFKQFLRNRNVMIAIAIYVLVYSGGNAIFANVSLHAKSILGETTDTLGIQSFLRFGFKSAAGALLGWLLTASSPRATLVATTSILLTGMIWALTSNGWWFMATFGLLGAGELFGAHFPNYVASASQKRYVRLNMALLTALSAFIGFSSLAFGIISDRYGRIASFYVSAGMLVAALILIAWLLPADPTPSKNDE